MASICGVDDLALDLDIFDFWVFSLYIDRKEVCDWVGITNPGEIPLEERICDV